MAAKQVILYFDDQKDALRFALAAGSVMSSESEAGAEEKHSLVQETQRARRVFLEEAANAAHSAEPIV